MVDKKLDNLLQEAKKAYEKRDKSKGAQLVDEILKRDFTYPGAWQLLYRLYGAGQTYPEFQHSFAQKYYPDKLDLLVSPEATPKNPIPPVVENNTLFSRLFGRSSKPATAGQLTTGSLIPPIGTSGKASEKPSIEGSSQNQTISQQGTSQSSLLSTNAPRSPGPDSLSRYTPYPAIQSPQPISRLSTPPSERQKIRVMVVDDIGETRENIIRSLRFQEDIEVVGTAGNGAAAIQLAKETKPDVVIMDVNMPNMDGIEATAGIKREVPFTQVVMLTVQDDVDYIRKAMMAGARDFLSKPPMIDDLVLAVQRAGEMAQQERAKVPPLSAALTPAKPTSRGRIITVYSPRGGAGCTMLASNLAVTLYNEETHVVLVDGNLQFGDVQVLFNVKGRNSILDLALRAEELDAELVEEVVTQHSSGIHLLTPPRPDEAEKVTGAQFAQLLAFLSQIYPYVIVDTTHWLTDITLAAFDSSDLILLIATQDVPCIARMRKFLDLVPLLKVNPQNLVMVMNQYDKRIGLTPEKISQAFNREITAVLPTEMGIVIPSVNRGVPFMLQKEALSHPIARSVLATAEVIRKRIAQLEEQASAV